MSGVPVFRIVSHDFIEALPEYSASLPTGTKVGKQWKAWRYILSEFPYWVLGEYVEHPDPKYIGIRWTPILAHVFVDFYGVRYFRLSDGTLAAAHAMTKEQQTLLYEWEVSNNPEY